VANFGLTVVKHALSRRRNQIRKLRNKINLGSFPARGGAWVFGYAMATERTGVISAAASRIAGKGYRLIYLKNSAGDDFWS
jgi:hypothetical protein